MQQHIKRLIQHDQGGFFSEVQEWLVQHKKISVTHHINTAKGKTTTIISV